MPTAPREYAHQLLLTPESKLKRMHSPMEGVSLVRTMAAKTLGFVFTWLKGSNP